MPLRKSTPVESVNHPKATTIPSVPLYHPSVFRYSCRGRLRLDSRVPSAGVCQGMQTQLQAVEHLRLATKEEALSYFQQKSVEGDQPMDEISTAAANSGTAHAIQSAYLSNVLVYPKHKDERNKPEDSTEKWSCVGSTEVDLLVLRPQDSKEEQIAAVSPYCAPGMTTRDVTTPTLGRDRTSTIRLGFFEIVYVSSVSTDGIDDDEDESMPFPEQNQQQIKQKQKQQTQSNEKEPNSISNSNQNRNNPKLPTRNTTKKDKQSMPTKIYNSGSNIWQHMKINAQLLYEATQDEFPSRTLAASKRIAKEFGTTFDRTLGLMKRVVFWDWDDDDKKK